MLNTQDNPASPSKSRLLVLALASVSLAVSLATPVAAAQRKGKSVEVVVKNNPRVVWKTPSRLRTVVKPKGIASRVAVVAPRRRSIGHLVVHRPYGPAIYGYGFHYADAEAARWIAFTAITIRLLDRMDEEQARYHEQAQIEATNAAIGEHIIWESDGASGSVTPLREGTNENGHSCREFQQIVTIGGQQETAFGTACLEANGSWRIVN